MRVRLIDGDVYGGYYIVFYVSAIKTGDKPFFIGEYSTTGDDVKSVKGDTLDDVAVNVGSAIVRELQANGGEVVSDDEQRLLVNDIVDIIKVAIAVELH